MGNIDVSERCCLNSYRLELPSRYADSLLQLLTVDLQDKDDSDLMATVFIMII